MDALRETSRKKAAKLIESAKLIHRPSNLIREKHGYYVFFTETGKGKDDGPVLLVKGKQFKWLEHNSNEAEELRNSEEEFERMLPQPE